MKFSEFLKERRQETQMTISTMATKLQISPSLYQKWEGGTALPTKKYEEIVCLTFRLTINQLQEMIDQGKAGIAGGHKKLPVTQMLSTLKRNKVAMLEDLPGNNPAMMKLQIKIDDYINSAIEWIEKLKPIEELFFN